jgi:gas vesicle protein
MELSNHRTFEPSNDRLCERNEKAMNTYSGMDQESDGRLMAFVCGVLVGASAALLLAPMTGSDLRATINERSRYGRDRLRRMGQDSRRWAEQTAHDAGEWAQQTVHQANVRSRDALQRATEKVDSAVDRAQSVVNQGVQRAHEATDRARSALNRGIDVTRSAAHEAERRGSETLSAAEERVREQWS